MNFAKNDILTLAISSRPKALSLDYTNRRVYWLSSHGISSRSYDGGNTTVLRSGLFNTHWLGIFKDSLYFQKIYPRGYINEMNISSGMISSRIRVDQTYFYDMVVVHSSLQPMGELPKSNILFMGLSLRQNLSGRTNLITKTVTGLTSMFTVNVPSLFVLSLITKMCSFQSFASSRAACFSKHWV